MDLKLFLIEEKFDISVRIQSILLKKILKESLFKNIYLFVMQTVRCSM